MNNDAKETLEATGKAFGAKIVQAVKTAIVTISSLIKILLSKVFSKNTSEAEASSK